MACGREDLIEFLEPTHQPFRVTIHHDDEASRFLGISAYDSFDETGVLLKYEVDSTLRLARFNPHSSPAETPLQDRPEQLLLLDVLTQK
jgi:hypothetical protein